MKTKILSIATVLFLAISITSCTKEDETTYTGNEVFFWKESFNDNCLNNDIENIQIYLDGELVGTLPVPNTGFDHDAACGEAGALSITLELGTEQTKTFTLLAKLLDSTGAVAYTISGEIHPMADGCQPYEFDDTQVSW